MHDNGPLQKALAKEHMDMEFPRSPVGRIRLLVALENRWGKGFRSIPAAREALQHFDSEIQDMKLMMKLRSMKHG